MDDGSVELTTDAGDRNDDSPLDSYVEAVMRWAAASPGGLALHQLTAATAERFDWPPPFAEAILTAITGRRFMRQNHLSSRPIRLMLSQRGILWLESRKPPS